MVRLLSAPEWELRWAAAQALGQIRAAAAVPALTACLTAAEGEVRDPFWRRGSRVFGHGSCRPHRRGPNCILKGIETLLKMDETL